VSAYLIVDVDIRDPDKYAEYKRQVPALIARHGGEFIVRGGALEVLEGDWTPTRLVMFRFPSLEAIHAFVDDPDYQPLKALRQKVSTLCMVAVEGM